MIVVGAGITGRCTAWWLARRGARVTLLDQYGLDHTRGSSHGRSRITRSAYSAAAYVRLMQVAHREAWPALEADVGATLRHPRMGCVFGPVDGPLATYAAALAEAGLPTDLRTGADARSLFPVFRFPDGVGALGDPSAAVIAAADTLDALAALTRDRCQVRTGVRVHAVDPSTPAVDTDAGRMTADRVVVAAGPWATRLFPSLRPRLTPVRQRVAYVDMPGAADFPVWIWADPDAVFYGLPAFQRPGLKAARHRMQGEPDDPDAEGTRDLDDVLAFLGTHLAAPVGAVLGAETCFYTNTDDEDFLVDHHPEGPGVVVGLGLSGHGFKFGPLLGRILAELALDGRSSVAAFEAERARFAWGTHAR